MIFIKKIYLFLVLWIVILFGVFVFLLGTNLGTNFIFNEFSYHIPELTCDSVSGTWGNFKFINLSYNFPSGMVNIGSIDVSINLRYILCKQVNFESFFLKDVLIKTNKHLFFNKITDSGQLNIIFNIFKNLHSIIIKKIILNNVHIILDNSEIRCHEINSGLTLCNNLLKILPTRIVGGSIVNKLSVKLFYNKYNITMIHKLFYSKNILDMKSTFKSILRYLSTIFPKYNIPLDLICTDIQGEKFRICNYDYNNDYYFYMVDYFQIQGDWNKDIANIKLKVDIPCGYFNSIGSIAFNNNYAVNVISNYINRDLIQCNSDCKSELNVKNIRLVITGSLIDTICIHCDIFNIVSVMRILLRMTLKDFEIPIQLFITGRSIPIVILRKNKYILKDFDLCLEGKLYSNYYVKIKSTVMSLNKNIAYISLHAQGDVNSFSISKLKLKVLNGYCEMQGIMNWEKTFTWNNTCVFKNINILQEYSKYPTSLSGTIVMTGHVSNDSWELMISKFCCQGYVKDSYILCNGLVYIGSNDKLSIPIFLISWGSNILEIQGTIDKNHIINIDLKLKLADCSNFFSNLNSSAIYGFCGIRGSTISPELSLKIDVSDLYWKDQNIHINHVGIISNFFYKNPVKNDFSLQVNHIKYKDLLIRQLCIRGKGDLIKHDLNIKLCGDKISGIINCIGEFNSGCKIWNGQIDKTKILTPIGTWELMQDIIIIYQVLPKRIIIKSHYWESANCQFFISDKIHRSIFEKINVICQNYHFPSFDILQIKSINVSDIRVSCSDIDWVIGYNKSLPEGTIFLSSAALSMQYVDQKNVSFITINKIAVDTVFTQTDLFFRCIIANTNQDIIEFSITDLYHKPKILGAIRINNIFLNSIFQLSLKSGKFVQGILNVDINFKGSLLRPEIYGFLKLQELCISHSIMPFVIKNGIIEIKCFGNYAVFHGIADTEYDHKLYCNGKIIDIYSINDIQILAHIRGNQININISPVVYAKISPNLIFTITTKNIDIKGDIVVDSASITVQELIKNTVDSSSEEVIVDEKYGFVSDKSKSFSICVSAVLSVHLGDSVNFSGLGLYGKLKGNLEMIYNQNDFALIGHVSISSGYIELYGQNLIIKKGQLLFSGALNQTYFDIEAIRSSAIFSHFKDSVTAGIRIVGLINQLKLDFFSDSSLLSQQEIMSYLLNGSEIFSNPEDTNMITSLLIGVGMKRCEKVINKIGKVLGVHSLKLSTQDFGIPSSIALSGYIAPGLQVQYGINISDLLTTMTIRYCIHPQLYLEAKSSNYHQSSLDLLYKFDFN